MHVFTACMCRMGEHWKQSYFAEVIDIIGVEISTCDENGDGPRSEVKAIPAAKENGTYEQSNEEVYLNGALRLETVVHKIRVHLYSSIILISSRISKFRQKWLRRRISTTISNHQFTTSTRERISYYYSYKNVTSVPTTIHTPFVSKYRR